MVDLLCPIREEIIFAWMDFLADEKEKVQELKRQWESENADEPDVHVLEGVQELKEALKPALDALTPSDEFTPTTQRFFDEFMSCAVPLPPNGDDEEKSEVPYGTIRDECWSGALSEAEKVEWKRIGINKSCVELEMMSAYKKFTSAAGALTSDFEFDNVKDMISGVYDHGSLFSVWESVMPCLANCQSGDFSDSGIASMKIDVVKYLNDRLFRFRKFFGVCVKKCCVNSMPINDTTRHMYPTMK